MHIPLSSVRSSGEESLHGVQPCQPWRDPENGSQEGNGVHSLLQDLRDHRQWHVRSSLEVTNLEVKLNLERVVFDRGDCGGERASQLQPRALDPISTLTGIINNPKLQ
jgi:hypothetical protein